MKSSRSAKEWGENCDRVKAACGGYPAFWYEAILASGVACDTMAAYGGSDRITLRSF
jgi:hypothetical protein